MGELYGEFNPMTRVTDGLGSTISVLKFRSTDDRLYTMFDGPIDTLWIESLNTVLDDNRMLCLANGEDTLMNLGVGPAEMRMFFEVEDLEQIVLLLCHAWCSILHPIDTRWRPYVKSGWSGSWRYHG